MKTQTMARVSTVQFNSPIPCYKYHDDLRIAILWQFYRPIVVPILKSNQVWFETIAAVTYLNK